MKCRKCGEEAIGFIEKRIFFKPGLLGFSINYRSVYEAVCEKHLREEEIEFENL